MAEITVHLTDGTHDPAAFEPHRDDEVQYRRGTQLGMAWAIAAGGTEIQEIVPLSSHQWRRFRVNLATSTLPLAYCRAQLLHDPAAAGHYWFSRDSFTKGMVDGVLVAARTRLLAP